MDQPIYDNSIQHKQTHQPSSINSTKLKKQKQNNNTHSTLNKNLKQNQLNTIRKLLLLQAGNIQIIKDNKKEYDNDVQQIFELCCQHKPQLLPILVQYIQADFEKGKIKLRQQQYEKYYNIYIRDNISKVTNTQTMNVQQNKQSIANNEIQKQIIKQLKTQLLKQQYRFKKIDQILNRSIQNQIFCLWASINTCDYSQQNNSIKIQQYYHHLLHKIIHNKPYNNKYLIQLIRQGWYKQQSRNYLLQYIVTISTYLPKQIPYNNNQLNSEQLILYQLSFILQRKVFKYKQNNQVGLADWLFVREYCMDGDWRYGNYCIIRVLEQLQIQLESKQQQNIGQILKLLKYLTPSQLKHIYTLKETTTLKTITSLFTYINSAKQLSTNLRYVSFLTSLHLSQKSTVQQNIVKKYEKLLKYSKQQTQIIISQLVNNSYPTLSIIVQSYQTITNIISYYQQLQQQLSNCQCITNGQDIWIVKNKCVTVIAKLCKIISPYMIRQVYKQQQYQEQDQIEQQKILNNRQRLKLLYNHINSNNQPITLSTTSLQQMSIHQILKILYYQIHAYSSTTNIVAILQYHINNTNSNKYYIELLIIKSLQYLTFNINNLQQQQNQVTNLISLISQFLQKQIQTTVSTIKGIQKSTILFNMILQLLLVVSKYNIKEQQIIRVVNNYLNKYFYTVNKQQKYVSYLIHNTPCSACQNIANYKNYYTYSTTICRLSISASLISLTQSICSSQAKDISQPIIKQLIYNCSQLLSKISTILTNPQPTSTQFSILTNCISNLSPLKTLYHYNNTLIKYNQITQHNKQHKQPVFQSDIYRNHWSMYIILNALDIWLKNVQQLSNKQQRQIIVKQICEYIVTKLNKIVELDNKVIATSDLFYQMLFLWKIVYNLMYHQQILQYLILHYDIISILLKITKLGAIHHLIRQYLSVIMGKIYVGTSILLINNKNNITKSQFQQIVEKRKKWRYILQNQIDTDTHQVNINIFVPILFTLGYQMMSYVQNNIQYKQQLSQQNYEIMKAQIQQTFDIFIKFISCHHAYIRSIAQYYIKKRLQLNKRQVDSQQKNQFDKKSKQKQQDQNKLINKVKQNSFLMYLCEHVWKYDKDCIKIMRNIGIAVQGYSEAMKSNKALDFLGFQRVEEYPSQIIVRQMKQDLFIILRQCHKNNQHKIKYYFNTNGLKQQYLKIKKLNIFNKNIFTQVTNLSNKLHRDTKLLTPLVIHYQKPQIIIIATLLQKVHNFGYILRTLHNKRALLLVPSKQPLEHLQCQQFIPKNSQVEVIEIKQNQLQNFIKLNKRLGYPLIGLEQCAGSVKIQQYSFPSKYMLFLGNQRLGAPASLLNQCDVLVQIPQVGKVRSLNVHVSMVICLWQSIIKNVDMKK